MNGEGRGFGRRGVAPSRGAGLVQPIIGMNQEGGAWRECGRGFHTGFTHRKEWVGGAFWHWGRGRCKRGGALNGAGGAIGKEEGPKWGVGGAYVKWEGLKVGVAKGWLCVGIGGMEGKWAGL